MINLLTEPPGTWPTAGDASSFIEASSLETAKVLEKLGLHHAGAAGPKAWLALAVA